MVKLNVLVCDMEANMQDAAKTVSQAPAGGNPWF